MTCPDCNGTGIIVTVVYNLDGEKEPCPVMCGCNEPDRKDFIHDVCEAAPKSGYCSEEGAASPE